MADSWIHFTCEIESKPALVLLNVGIRPLAPDSKRQTLLWMGVYCRQIPDGAFWNESETETLDRVEDRLIGAVGSDLSAQYAVRLATPGIREYFFYAGSNDGLLEATEAVKAAFPDYRVECDSRIDEGWDRYLSFYNYASTRQTSN